MVVAIAVTFMGVGYSLWTQTIPITMSGSLGTFKIKVADAQAVKANGELLEDDTLAFATHDKDSAVLVAANLLPGSSRKYAVKFKNIGNIDAILRNVKLTPKNGPEDVLAHISIKIGNKEKMVMSSVQTVTLNQKLSTNDSLTLTVILTLAKDATLTEQDQAFEIELKPLFEQH